MFPIGDDNTGRTMTPVINYLLILVNILVFIFLQGLLNTLTSGNVMGDAH